MARHELAAWMAGMIPEAPPQWLERILLLLLTARDRETVSGDLLEEYREEQLPRMGYTRANFWYLRQSLSFASVRIWGAPLMKQTLTAICLFAVAAGVWLGVMENVLKHEGYAQRIGIDACIVAQGLATLLCLALNANVFFRGLVIAGAVGIAWLGGSAIFRVFHAQHFEGFVLVIGAALIIQGALTLAALMRTNGGKTV